MRREPKKSFSLSHSKKKQSSYALKSFSLAKEGCYSINKEIHIDGGYGDYNMKLFRVKKKKQYSKDIPSAFSPSFREMIKEKSQNPQGERITTDHNDAIDKILNTPNQIYLQKIQKEKKQISQKEESQRKSKQFVQGYDQQIREFKDQLSFSYLTQHQTNWFKIKDYSSTFKTPSLKQDQKNYIFSTPQPKPKNKKRFIFISDQFKTTSYLKTF